jgi:CCR4-NOT transcription complex subunit 1
MKVYDDFSQIGVQRPLISQVWSAAAANEYPFSQMGPDKSMHAAAANPLQQIMEKISALLKELNRIIQQNPQVSLSTLPPNHEIVTLVRQIIVAASQFTVRDELAVWFAQKLVSLLYASEIVLGIEIYIILLEKICELSKLVSKEFTTWLLYSDDQVC